jgi:hypothetical protein
LRAHPDAMPEFQVLAYRMLDAYIKSEPRKLEWGEWHMPCFNNSDGTEQWGLSSKSEKFPSRFPLRLKIATARCARLSYLTHDGEHGPEKDIELHDRLLASGHFSPFEHCAQANDYSDLPLAKVNAMRSNFDFGVGLSGWLQYRKTLENECTTKIDPTAILARKPEWITL